MSPNLAVVDVDGFGGEDVEIRAYRGERRAAIYREHLIPAAVFSRAIEAAANRDLPILGSLDPFGSRELTRDDATALAEEIGTLRSGQDDVLAPHLDAMLGVVTFCRDSSEPSWLSFMGP